MNFTSQIATILGQVYGDEKTITSDGSKQLSMFLNKIAIIMASTASELVTMKPTNESLEMLSPPRKINKKTIETVAKLLLEPDLANYTIEEAKTSLSTKGKNLVFPKNMIKKLIKNKDISITKDAEIYFISILETLAVELLEFGGEAAEQNGYSVITPRWLQLVLVFEPPYKQLSESLNFQFM